MRKTGISTDVGNRGVSTAQGKRYTGMDDKGFSTDIIGSSIKIKPTYLYVR